MKHTVVNKSSGAKYPVSEKDLKAIQENPETRDLYDYPAPAEEPDEVKAAKKAAEAKAPESDEKKEAAKAAKK